MRAAAETGIRKVIQTAPQTACDWFLHDFDVSDPPMAARTGYYLCTKYLGNEICRIYAREHGIQTICFLFNLTGPKPRVPVVREDFPPFHTVWEDLQHAIRLAIEVESISEHYPEFNMLSYHAHSKFSTEKARRMLGYTPLERRNRITGACRDHVIDNMKRLFHG